MGFLGIDFWSTLVWETVYGVCTDLKLEGDEGFIVYNELDWII